MYENKHEKWCQYLARRSRDLPSQCLDQLASKPRSLSTGCRRHSCSHKIDTLQSLGCLCSLNGKTDSLEHIALTCLGSKYLENPSLASTDRHHTCHKQDRSCCQLPPDDILCIHRSRWDSLPSFRENILLLQLVPC